MPHGITQYYLPPGRGDIPAFTPAEAGTRLTGGEGRQMQVRRVKITLVSFVTRTAHNSGGQTGEWALVQEEQMGPLLTREKFH